MTRCAPPPRDAAEPEPGAPAALRFHDDAARCRRMTFQEHVAHFATEGAYAGCRDWDKEAGVSRARLSP